MGNIYFAANKYWRPFAIPSLRSLRLASPLPRLCDTHKVFYFNKFFGGNCSAILTFGETMKKVTIYTDGACSSNPGAGGWAAVLTYGAKTKEISGFEAQTTNNRMELRAVIEALQAVKTGFLCEICSDSAYVVNAINNNWLTSWQLNGWKTADNKPVKNVDLWQRLQSELSRLEVSFVKVKGHADVELNERCDFLARSEIERYLNTTNP